MPAPEPRISASLSRDGLALTLEPDFGAFALRPLQYVGVGVFFVVTMVVAAWLSRSLTSFDRWIAYAVAAVVCGIGFLVVVQLIRLWPGREIARQAHRRFERSLAKGDPEHILHARALDMGVAASVPKRGSLAFDPVAWRNALADAGLRPVAAVFLGDAAPARMGELDDPGLVEPEDVSEHTNPYAGQPGFVVWFLGLVTLAWVAMALSIGRMNAMFNALIVGGCATVALLARFRLRPIQTKSVFIAPGRIAWTTARSVVDVTREEAVMIARRSSGSLVVAVHAGAKKSTTLHFRGPGDERYRRFMQLWLAPREPAPRVFEDVNAPDA